MILKTPKRSVLPDLPTNGIKKKIHYSKTNNHGWQ